LNPTRHTQNSDFDYRGGVYDDEDWDVHPNDNSLVTFRGHKVLRTIIRCHFSPPSATNSRYVYSGSTDGKVYIWNMDATLAGIVDVKKATMRTRPMNHRYRLYHFDERGDWGTCVRDASWHPSAPVLVGKLTPKFVTSPKLTILQPRHGTDTTWRRELALFIRSTRTSTTREIRPWAGASAMCSRKILTCTTTQRMLFIRARQDCRKDFGYIFVQLIVFPSCLDGVSSQPHLHSSPCTQKRTPSSSRRSIEFQRSMMSRSRHDSVKLRPIEGTRNKKGCV
jgi:hypothetical protein